MSSFSRFPASWLASPTLSVALKALALSLLVGLGSAAPGAGQVRGTLRAIDGDGNPVSNFPQSGGGLLAYVIKGTRRTATGNLGIFDGEGTVLAAGRKTGYGTFIVRSTTPTSRGLVGGPGPRSTGRWTYILDESNPAVRALEPGQSLREFVEIYVDLGGSRTQGGLVDITIYGSPGAGTDRIGDITDRDRFPVEQPPFRGGSSLQPPPFEGGGFPRSSKVSGLTGSVTKGSAEHSAGGQIIDSNNPKGGPDTFVVQKNTQGKYGRFTIDASGNWVYQLENDYPTTVALTEEATDSFRVYRLSRVYGQTVPREGVNSQRAEYLEYQVVVTILPGSPPNRIFGTLAGSVTEDAPGRGGKASGALGVHNAPVTFSKEGPGPTYGWFSLYNDGGQWRWTYTLDSSRAVTNRLNVGQGATETIGIRASNGATANIVITINGSDDPAVIGGTLAGTVTADATRITTTDYDLGCRPLNENDGTPLGNCAGRDTSTGSGTETKKVVVDTVRGGILISDVDDRPPPLVEATQRGRFGSLETIDGGGTVTPAGGNRTYRYGAWFYTLDNDLAATNALAAGQSQIDPFVIQFSDGTTARVVITITGADDPSTISGILTGAVTEDDLARSTATGTVTVNDVDVPSTATIRAQRTVGTYGHFSIEPNGDWAYTIGNLFPATDALGPGGAGEDRFVIRSSDGGAAIVIITVAGARDGIVGGQLRGVVTEVGGMAAGVATQADGGSFTAQSGTAGTYGTFAIQSDGGWSYTLDDDEAAIDALARGGRGERVTDEFDIREPGADSKEIVVGKVVITITGFLGDPPVISGDLEGAVTEDDPARNRATGTVVITGVAPGRTLKIIGVTDAPVSYDVVEDGNPPYDGIYGSFSIDGEGNWTYDLDDNNSNTNALREAQTETDIFTIEASNGTTAKVTITITGADDVSRLGGALSGFVSKRDITRYRTQGTVTPIDSDNGPVPLLTEQSDVSGVYGSFSIKANGVWTYDLDLSDPETIALGDGAITGVGGVTPEEFAITSSDGARATVTIRVQGATAVLGGDLQGSVIRDDILASSATGRVTMEVDGRPIFMQSGLIFRQVCYIEVIDHGPPVQYGGRICRVVDRSNTPFERTLEDGTYGSLSIDSTGRWLYILDSQNSNTQALRVGQQETETFEVEAIRLAGDEEQLKATITITVTAANQPAVFDATTLTGAITEDTATTSGTVRATDADGDDNKFTAAGSSNPISGSYGSLTINEDGAWTYTLDNSLAAVQALGQGATLQDGLAIQAADGTAGTLVITITGADDQATIGGDLAGSVTEDAMETMATGTVTLSDIDGGSSLTAQTNTPGKYGTLSLNATSGVWTYSLDNSDSDTQALRAGQTVNDETFDIADLGNGASATVTISITGADDPTSIDGDLAGSVTEDATETMATGTVTSSVDDATFAAQTNASGRYGTFGLATTGDWTYSLDNNDTDTNALADGVEVTDSFTIAASDGSTAAVVITVTGANDAASITGTLTGSVMEDGTLTASGTAQVTDVDMDDNKFTAAGSSNPISGTYGSLTITEDGAWTYSLDNSNAMVNALGQGAMLTDSLTIQAKDGTAETITITITGANDAAVFDALTLTGTITEDGFRTRGTVRATDVDGDDNKFIAVIAPDSISGSYGSLTITEDGAWTYTLENVPAAQALGQGQTLQDNLTIQAADETPGTLVITITGIDDQATITGTLAGSVTEDAAAPGDRAGATLAFTDVDGTPSFTEQTDTVGKYGTFNLTSAGVWSYVLDNDDADTNALSSGQTVSDETFAIAASDGASATITITITGADDPSVLAGDQRGSVTEDAPLTGSGVLRVATGQVGWTDVDSAATATITESSGTGTNGYGTFRVEHIGGDTARANWTYTLKPGSELADINNLKPGDTPLEDRFTIGTSDSTRSLEVTIIINGSSDLTGDLTGAVTEDAMDTSDPPQRIDTATGRVGIDGADVMDRFTASSGIAGSYGVLAITADGEWTYTLDHNPDAAGAAGTRGARTQSLGGGQTATDRFNIPIKDAGSQPPGSFIPTVRIVITVTGATDAGDVEGNQITVQEDQDADGNPATGKVNFEETLNLGVDSDGNAITFLRTVTPEGGTAVETTSANPAVGTYGTLYIKTGGLEYVYTLDNDDPDTNALDDTNTVALGAAVTDVFGITINNATQDKAEITITIEGNDDPAVITGVLTGSITEDFMPVDPVNTAVRGYITITDPDDDSKMLVDNPTDDDGVPGRDSLTNPRLTDNPNTEAPNGYGTLFVHESGIWQYYLNNDLPVIQKLGGTGRLTDTFPGLRTVGGEMVTITITIFGANDPAVIEVQFDSGDDEVTEDLDRRVSGTATVTDTDEGEDNFLALESGDETGTYGDFSFTPGTGVWSYELDAGRSNPLRGGQKATESLTITTTDGTTKAIVVNVTGTNDAAVIDRAGSTATITENGSDGNTAVVTGKGRIAVSDVDREESFMTGQVSPVQGTYGTFTISRTGAWVYTLDNANPVVNALTGGQTVTDTFPITSLDGTALFDDGTPAQVVVTIRGTTDFEIRDEDGQLMPDPEVTEDGDAGQTTISGRVVPTDSLPPGSDTRRFAAQPGPGDSDVDPRGVKTTYGFFTIDTEGNWTYTLDNENHATNRLAVNETVEDSIRIELSDGAIMSLVIKVKGAALNADTARITTSPTQLQITEGGEPGQYMVVMTEPPAGTVTITPMSSDTAMATVSGPVEFTRTDWTDENEGKPVAKVVTVTPNPAADDDEFRGIQNLTISHSIAAPEVRDAVYRLDADKLAELDVAVKIADDEVDPILVPITGYLQDRAGTLLDNQPRLTQLLRQWQIRGASGSVEGNLSLQVSEDTFGFDGSFVGDGVWGQLSGVRSGLDDDVSSNDSDSLFGALGAYRSVSGTALAGLMLQFDSADARLDADQGIIEGQVWLLGPYFVARHQTQPLTFNGRLLYGQSDNDIRFTDEVLGLRTGSFDTTIFLASLRVEGEVLLDYANRDIRVVPHLDIDWIEDEAAPFTDDGGNPVPGQTVRLQELALGSDVELPLRFGQRDATISGGLSVVSTREESWVDGATRLPAVSDTFGRARIGLDYQLNPRVRLEFGGSYEDLEDSDSGTTDRYNLTFGLRSTF